VDIASIVGLLAGIALVLASILMGSGLGTFINLPSVLVVVGGSIAATAIAFPGKELKLIVTNLSRVFKSPKAEMIALMQFLLEVRKASGKDGLLALEGLAEQAPSEAVRKGLLLAADATDSGTLQEIMDTEEKAIQKRYQVGSQIFNEMAKFAPAFGMIGTLIGLVQMLATLDDPATIGPKMAVALLTTLYGALVANLFCLPMVTKLGRRLEIEMTQLQLASVGLVALRKEDSLVLMREEFKAFMPEKADLDSVLGE
jgi:chemotaxis protein MotA